MAPGSTRIRRHASRPLVHPASVWQTNPPPTKQVALPITWQRELFRTACQDCHSYNTDWLWYSNVAPFSWLIQSDVDGGRERLNLSSWDKPQPELGDVVEQIQSGEMPPLKYWISPGGGREAAASPKVPCR